MTEGLLKRLYREELAAWRDHYRRYFKYAARALGLGFVGHFFLFSLWPSGEQKALDLVVNALKDVRLEGPAPLLALTLFYNNVRASVVAVAAGIVPFLFLPILDAFINGGVLGLVVSISRHQGLNVPLLVLTQILPHGVFELTALLYTTSVGMDLSAEMGKKAVAAWKRRSGTSAQGTSPPSSNPRSSSAGGASRIPGDPSRALGGKPSGLGPNIVRSFVLVVLPLLLVAAAIEGFITPHLR